MSTDNTVEEIVKKLWQQASAPTSENDMISEEHIRQALTTYAEQVRREERKKLYKEMEDWQNLRTATDEPTNAAQVMNKLQALSDKSV